MQEAVARSEARETMLVVAADERTRLEIRAALRGPGREVVLAPSGREALGLLQELQPDVVLLDLDLPDMGGVRALDLFGERLRGVPILAVTRQASLGGAVEAVRHGAVDYLDLPLVRSRVLEATERAIRESRTRNRLQQVQKDVRDRYGFSHLLTQSPRMLRVFDQIRSVAGTDATVLILGETGTGKELVSQAIHQRSQRREQPLISVNCGAFTESLLESELFGHEKGSFTGAVGRREGLFEMADRGTLFLDELGETTLNVQVNLLRVLEEMTFRRVGGRESVRVDVRILAATNVEIENAVKEGRFREDLFYRLNVFPIHLPPLRERREDIPLLMRHFMDEVSEDYGLEPPTVAAEAMDAILGYRWPGNVRQLRAFCERWVITHSGRRLEREHLPAALTGAAPVSDEPAGFDLDEGRSLKDNLERAAAQIERAYLYRALRRAGGQLQKAAKHAGISRRTLYTKMKQHRLDAEDFREE